MKNSTAYNIIQKEADFLGISFFDALVDIKKYRRMIYRPEVVEAFDIVFNDGCKLFAVKDGE